VLITQAWLWHACFGHLNFQALRLLFREEMVRVMPEIEHVEHICTGCLVGKQKRASFSRQAECRVDDVLEVVHGNICGPIAPATPNGNHYFILLVDDDSCFMWLKVLATKDGASAVIK
jgi:hypothetical protein